MGVVHGRDARRPQYVLLVNALAYCVGLASFSRQISFVICILIRRLGFIHLVVSSPIVLVNGSLLLSFTLVSSYSTAEVAPTVYLLRKHEALHSVRSLLRS